MKTDGELCAAWRVGDEAAFTALFRRHEGRLWALAWRMSRNYPPALNVDDAFEAGMLVMLNAASTYGADNGASFATYLWRRAAGAMIDVARGYTHRGKLKNVAPWGVPDVEAAAQTPADRESQAGRLEVLHAALETLPEIERRVIIQFDVEGLSLREIGAVCGRSESWACKIRSIAMERLRDRFGPKTINVDHEPAESNHDGWSERYHASERARLEGIEVPDPQAKLVAA